MQRETIKIFTLGRFSVMRGGKPLPMGKTGKRPVELLKVLVALDGVKVGKEEVSDILWPEAEGDKAHWVLGTTLKRLRGLLGIKESLILRGGKISLNPEHVWVDVWAFEKAFEEAEREASGERKEGAIKLAAKAIDLYRGHFLTGEGGPWVSQARERLRSRFIRCLSLCGRLCEECGDSAAAISCYQRGLEVNHLAEEFYQCLMLCLMRQGRRAEALQVYERLRKVFSELGIEPSKRTEEIKRGI